MNKPRPFFPAFTGVASGLACLAVVAVFPLTNHAQQEEDGSVRPTVRPVANTAGPAPAEVPGTPAPDADDSERTPPTDDGSDKSGTTETNIEATEAASFNSKDRVAVFIGNVKVTDPRFQLVCDKLTVFLNKPVPAGQNVPATPAPIATPAPTGKKGKGGDPAAAGGGGGIDHVVAEGRVVILQKKAPTKPGEEEKISIGRGERGTFDNKSGDMILSGWPSLEQNGSSLISTAQSTVMTIHRDSSLDTKGPSKTTLIQKKGSGNTLDLPTGPSNPAGGNNRRGNATNPPAPAGAPARTR